jgi:hypothetical protein
LHFRFVTIPDRLGFLSQGFPFFLARWAFLDLDGHVFRGRLLQVIPNLAGESRFHGKHPGSAATRTLEPDTAITNGLIHLILLRFAIGAWGARNGIFRP